MIGERIVAFLPTGFRPSRVAARIFQSLDEHAEATSQGVATTVNLGFAVPELASGRESFSPDAAYHGGPFPADEMDSVPAEPTFAIEIRNKGDFIPAAEFAMAAQRADYFETGTAVVWDVDPQTSVIRSYLAPNPDDPILSESGQIADAEPAVPGWRLAVDRIFA